MSKSGASHDASNLDKFAADFTDSESTKYTIGIGPRPLSMPDRDYYLRLESVFLFAGLVGLMAFTFFGMMAHAMPWDRPRIGLLPALYYYLQWWGSSLSFGHSFQSPTLSGLEAVHPYGFQLRAMAVGLLAALSALGMGALSWRYTNNERHVVGQRLWTGREAVQQAIQQARKLRDAFGSGFLKLHPVLDLPKKQWTKHLFMYGAVGAGKTAILKPLIARLVRRKIRTLIYCTKGDFVRAFGKNGTIISPWDARSAVWDIGAELHKSRSMVDVFLETMVPDGGKGDDDFWNKASKIVLTGIIETLFLRHGPNWGWRMLAEAMRRPVEATMVDIATVGYETHPFADPHSLKAIESAKAILGSDPTSKTSQSIAQTMQAMSKVVDTFDMAWGHDEEGYFPTDNARALAKAQRKAVAGDSYRPRQKNRFTLHQWIFHPEQLNRRRTLIVRSGDSKDVTRGYVGALVNILAATLMSPRLQDDETGRDIAVVLDELPSLGRVRIEPLIDRGRSKGVVFIGAMQDIGQLKEVYGENIAKGLQSMVGTHVVCKMGPGESRQAMSQMLSTRRVQSYSASESASASGTSVSGSYKEDSRQVVPEAVLTSQLGVKRNDHGTLVVRAIALIDEDPLLLGWPVMNIPDRCEQDCPADWTIRTQEPTPRVPPNIERVPERLETQENKSLQAKGSSILSTLMASKAKEDAKRLAETETSAMMKEGVEEVSVEDWNEFSYDEPNFDEEEATIEAR